MIPAQPRSVDDTPGSYPQAGVSSTKLFTAAKGTPAQYALSPRPPVARFSRIGQSKPHFVAPHVVFWRIGQTGTFLSPVEVRFGRNGHSDGVSVLRLSYSEESDNLGYKLGPRMTDSGESDI